MDNSTEALIELLDFVFIPSFRRFTASSGKNRVFCTFPDDAVDRRKLGIKEMHQLMQGLNRIVH